MPNFSGVNFGKIRKAVKFPVEFPVESKSGRIHSKVSGTVKFSSRKFLFLFHTVLLITSRVIQKLIILNNFIVNYQL